ncbi:hypothetical protein HDU84_006263 [Entophlyctis sp. JEL0112]|nr:hypothetical protein HDU84_006263 [Entophlyctis sp. JEL0112]
MATDAGEDSSGTVTGSVARAKNTQTPRGSGLPSETFSTHCSPTAETTPRHHTTYTNIADKSSSCSCMSSNISRNDNNCNDCKEATSSCDSCSQNKQSTLASGTGASKSRFAQTQTHAVIITTATTTTTITTATSATTDAAVSTPKASLPPAINDGLGLILATALAIALVVAAIGGAIACCRAIATTTTTVEAIGAQKAANRESSSRQQTENHTRAPSAPAAAYSADSRGGSPTSPTGSTRVPRFWFGDDFFEDTDYRARVDEVVTRRRSGDDYGNGDGSEGISDNDHGDDNPRLY